MPKRKKKQNKASPKASPKAKVKIIKNALESKMSELDKHMPFRTCYVCQRESRDLQRIGPEKFRHHDCNPGSANWCEYWETLHPSQKTDAGQLLYNSAKRK